MTTGTYRYYVYYFENDIQNATQLDSAFDYDEKLSFISEFKVSSQALPAVIDVTSKEAIPSIAEDIGKSAWDLFVEGLINALTWISLGGTIGGLMLWTIVKESYYGGKAALGKAPDDSIFIPNKFEKKQDKLSQQYRQDNSGYSQTQQQRFGKY